MSNQTESLRMKRPFQFVSCVLLCLSLGAGMVVLRFRSLAQAPPADSSAIGYRRVAIFSHGQAPH